MENRYLITLKKWSDEIDGTYFVARVPELKGCMSDGVTIKEALFNIRDAISEYIEAVMESGHEVPEPINDKEIVKLLGNYSKEEIEDGYQAVEKLRSILNSIEP